MSRTRAAQRPSVGRTLAALLGAAAAAALLAGCASSAPGGAPGISSDDLVGRWIPTVEGAAPDAFLALEDDGTLTLSDGCNGAQGEWSLDGEVFSISSGPSTKMYCEGYVDIHSWIAATEAVRLEDGQLVLVDTDGAALGEFTPDAS